MVENKPHIVFGCLRCVFEDVVAMIEGTVRCQTAVYIKFDLMRFTYGCVESRRVIDIYRIPKHATRLSD